MTDVICAIYARVSDESQVKGESIEHQISFARAFAERKALEDGLTWATPADFVFVDEGITGTSMVKRPAVQQLIQCAHKQQFQVVLFKGISRFARDTIDALLMLRTLIACGVRVISLEENFDSVRDRAEFIFTIHSALAQAESEKTAIRVRMGAMEKAKSGQWNGSVPDGYRLNSVSKRLEIDETMAPVIREIFDLYLSGMGCRRIAEILNARHFWTKQGNLWQQRNISRTLKNPVYVGDVVYGRRSKRLTMADETNPMSRRKVVVRTKNPLDVIVVHDAHPAIISKVDFADVQRVFASRRQTKGRSANIHLLSKGLLRCSCGSGMTVKYNGRGTAYYRCLGQGEKGKSFCAQGYIRASQVEEAVLARLRQDLRAGLSFANVQAPANHRPIAHLARIQEERQQQRRRTRLLFEKYAEGQLSDEQFAQLNSVIRHRLAFLEQLQKKLSIELPLTTKGTATDIESDIRTQLDDILQPGYQPQSLTRALLEAVIHHVQIQTDDPAHTKLCIHYRFSDGEST